MLQILPLEWSDIKQCTCLVYSLSTLVKPRLGSQILFSCNKQVKWRCIIFFFFFEKEWRCIIERQLEIQKFYAQYNNENIYVCVFI